MSIFTDMTEFQAFGLFFLFPMTVILLGTLIYACLPRGQKDEVI